MDYEKKYLKYKNKYLMLKNIQKGGKPRNKLYLFKADWCGYCKMFKNTWKSLKKENLDIELIEYDSEKDKKILMKYQIRGFPTILLERENEIVEYEGNRELEDLVNFIKKYNI